MLVTAALIAACSVQTSKLKGGSSTTASAPKKQAEQTSALHAIFDDEWQRSLRENPENASGLGDKRYNDRLSDRSIAAIDLSHTGDQAALERLAKIDATQLSETDRLNYQLFKQSFEDRVDGYRFHPFLMPVDHIYGLQSSQDILQVLSFAGEKDYRDWIARLNSFGTYADQTIELMRQGVAESRMPACSILKKIPEQVARQIVAKPQDSPFYEPFRHFPEGFTVPLRTQLARDGAQALGTVVVPAFKRFDAFFKSEYLPRCRIADGVGALPQGAEYYAYLAKHHTTTDLSPEQIHEIGQSEVRRIHGEMQKVIDQLHYKGGFDAFAKLLRTEKRFFFTNGNDLLDAYAALAKRIDGELPRLFGRLPRLPYGVRAVPAETAPYQTTAYYQPGAADGSRAGFFTANLYKPETRPKWEMEVLTSHEAVPGHHLQIALAQELEGLPEFRKNGLDYTAFVEGWALYSESLGYEIGLYKDPHSRYGQLAYEMWRACRLVVDTGLHAKGWTRQQAIDFMVKNTPRTEHDIEVEVDRYIAWPGQALAYKIGQLRIRALRTRAETSLGAGFDERGFHDVVLGSGAVPLDVLEQNVNEWIARQQAEMPAVPVTK